MFLHEGSFRDLLKGSLLGFPGFNIGTWITTDVTITITIIIVII